MMTDSKSPYTLKAEVNSNMVKFSRGDKEGLRKLQRECPYLHIQPVETYLDDNGRVYMVKGRRNRQIDWIIDLAEKIEEINRKEANSFY